MNDMNEVKDTLEQRGSVYGDYGSGVRTRAAIIAMLKQEYKINHNGTEMPAQYEGWLWDIVNKLIRLGVTPTHQDSWHDIQGYAKLIEDELAKQTETHGAASV